MYKVLLAQTGVILLSKNKILVVDDEARMRKLLSDFLTAKGYEVVEAENGQVALDIFSADSAINLILLDVMMPVLDGWATLREIRKISQVPIIMLTARGEERDELFGFELGVDEYIAKPFSPKILVARVEAILKRSFPTQEDVKDFDGIVIDKVAHTVVVDGKTIDMSMKEFELLVYLTKEGIAHVDNVIEAVYASLNSIKQKPILSTLSISM